MTHHSLRRFFTRAIALFGLLPSTMFAVLSLAHEISHFRNPCYEWGMLPGATIGGVRGGMPSGGVPCGGGWEGMSETKASVITRLASIQGGVLIACCTALAGVLRPRKGLLLTAAIIFLLYASLLLFGLTGLFGILSLFSALCLFAASGLLKEATLTA